MEESLCSVHTKIFEHKEYKAIFSCLCTCMLLYLGNFLEFILGGLTYPDDSVKSSVVYVLVQVCSKSHPVSLSLPLVQSMCQHISTNLATAKSQELTINLLGGYGIMIQ